MTMLTMSFFLMGENAVVMQPGSPILHAAPTSQKIDIDCQRKIWSATHQLRLQNYCIDIVPGMNNLTAIFDPLLYSSTTMLEQLEQAWALAQAQILTPRVMTISVDYGDDAGPDLAHVAKHTGLSKEDVIKLHTGAEYVVYFLGFQPGFAYMGGLPEQLATPRRAEPRLRVPAGSVGIGGSQTGIYPADSPGGWQLIGHTKTVLFDPLISTQKYGQKTQSESHSPTLLAPGDIVRFVDVRDAASQAHSCFNNVFSNSSQKT